MTITFPYLAVWVKWCRGDYPHNSDLNVYKSRNGNVCQVNAQRNRDNILAKS